MTHVCDIHTRTHTNAHTHTHTHTGFEETDICRIEKLSPKGRLQVAAGTHSHKSNWTSPLGKVKGGTIQQKYKKNTKKKKQQSKCAGTQRRCLVLNVMGHWLFRMSAAATPHHLQNVFSYYRMCSLAIECVLLLGFVARGLWLIRMFPAEQLLHPAHLKPN